MNQPTRAEQFVRNLIFDIERYARGMWRFRWRAVVAIWIVGVLGLVWVYSLPSTYRASARVYVDTENAIRPLLQGIAAPADVMSEVTVVTREMVSRPNLADVARNTGLQHRAKTQDEFEQLLVSLGNRIGVSGTRENIYSISYADIDRQMAVSVVDSLVTTFVQKSLGGSKTESNQAQQFLREQIAEYERRLTDAENKLADFKRKNVAVMPGKGGDYFSRLQAARTELSATEAMLKVANERRQELNRQIEGEEPTFGIMSANSESPTPARDSSSPKIRELEAQLEDLRLRYTDKHPRIGQLIETIETLKKQQQDQQNLVHADDQNSPPRLPAYQQLDLNPVYQNMRILLTNTEVEIASLRTQRAQQRAAIDELQRLVDTVPQVEAELVRLNRDYEVVKANHDQMLRQLESALIGEDAVASIDDIQFRVIDPPFASTKPVGPQRKLLVIGTLFVALGVGIALMLLSNIVDPVFFSGRSVTAVTGLPVLGTVSRSMTPEQIDSSRKQRFGVALALSTFIFTVSAIAAYADDLAAVIRQLVELTIL